MEFSRLCKFLEKLRSGEDRIAALWKFLETFNDPMNMYPVLRLIFPAADSERGQYGLKEGAIAKLFCEVLALPPSEKARVIAWKDPQSGGGDFPDVLLSALRPRVAVDDSVVTIDEVNSILDSLVAAGKDERKVIFTKLCKQLDANCMYWLIRIILKNMNIHVSVETFLKRLHPDAIELYNRSSSLKFVLMNLKDSAEQGLLFSAIKPMLAKRLLPSGVDAAFPGEYYVECKYDGERILAHIDKGDGGKVQLMTRNGKDYTMHYSAQLGPALLQSLRAQAAILDGEVISCEGGKVIAFGSNRTIAKNTDPSKGHLCFKVFDVLWLRDTGGSEFDMRATRLADRRVVLERIVAELPKKIELVSQVKVSSKHEVLAKLEEAATRGEEGLILKSPESLYELNARSGGWWKMKPDYDGMLNDTIDLVIIGGYFAESGRSSRMTSMESINSFLVAAVSNSSVIPVCKVGTGFSETDLKTIRGKLVSPIKNATPDWLGDWKPKKSDLPDFYFNPRNSVVLEIRAAQVTDSTSYPGGLSLRFPRCDRVRFDKDWHDCTTLEDLRDLVNMPMKRKQADDSSNSDDDKPKTKTAKVTTRGGLHIFAPVSPAKETQLKTDGRLLGVHVFVANGDNLAAKAVAEGAVLDKQYLPKITTHVFAERKDVRVTGLLHKYPDLPILDESWFI